MLRGCSIIFHTLGDRSAEAIRSTLRGPNGPPQPQKHCCTTTPFITGSAARFGRRPSEIEQAMRTVRVSVGVRARWHPRKAGLRHPLPLVRHRVRMYWVEEGWREWWIESVGPPRT
jgi:hypothetical protein